METVTPRLEVEAASPDPVPPMPKPYLTAGGTLVIPFESDPKYHWWKGGQSVKQTRAEVEARMAAERAGPDGSAGVR
jgi:hypothetical protein